MRRLYLQIYLALLGVLLLLGVAVSLLWWGQDERPGENELFAVLAELVAERLPVAAGVDAWGAELGPLGRRLRLNLSLYDSDRNLLWSRGQALPAPGAGRQGSGWIRGSAGAPAVALRLPDQRWLVGQREHRHGGRWIGGLLLFLLILALAAYPLSRRLTRRLEALRRGVDEFGRGDLATRVHVRGRDEIAAVAAGFNTAAGRIERLVAAQRHTLAGASHELRTPLARLRMALELAAPSVPARIAAQIQADINELDELVGELLLASRLQAGEAPGERSHVDLLGLAAEECARVDADLDGNPVSVRGDVRLLRRMLRNLLANARRYGGAGPIDVSVQPSATGARIRVCDRGPGIDDAESERVFEPFYRSTRVREQGPAGVGIGLALVRQIARSHGGDARCLARDGGGVCFEIDLAATLDVARAGGKQTEPE